MRLLCHPNSHLHLFKKKKCLLVYVVFIVFFSFLTCAKHGFLNSKHCMQELSYTDYWLMVRYTLQKKYDSGSRAEPNIAISKEDSL